MNSLPTALDGRPVRTRMRAWLEAEGNPDEGPFLVDRNSPREPRDIVIEEEAIVKIEVKEEPDEGGGLEFEVEVHQENEPARKRVKLEDDDIQEIIILTDEIDIPIESVNEDQGQEMEQAADDEECVRPSDLPMRAQVDETTSLEIDYVVPPNVDDEMPPAATDIEAVLLQQQKVFKEISKLNSLVETLSFKPAIASTSVSCQTSSDEEDYGASQIKILKLFPEVIKVYWKKYARLQPNSRKLLNLDCRRVCKIWKEGMDKVLQGKYTPLKNIPPTVVIPLGDFETVKIVDQVPEAYKNVELTACPFFSSTVMTHIAPEFTISNGTVLQFINSSGPDFELDNPVATATEDPVTSEDPDTSEDEDYIPSATPDTSEEEGSIASASPDITEDEDPIASVSPDASKDEGPIASASPNASEDEDSIASALTSSQIGNEKRDHHDASHSKILELFPEVIKVYWENYAWFQPNSRKLLNLNCRQACKPWKEGMDKVLAGKYTPLKNIHPIVMIPHGDVVRTVEVVNQVLEAYNNVDLALCPFPPRVLEIRDQNTTQISQQISLSRFTILKFINKFGSLLKEFKYYGVMGEKQLYQFTSPADWHLTVIGKWIGRMRNLEKLTMRNSLDKELLFPYPYALVRVQELSDQLASYPLFPNLQKLKSLEEYLVPFSVITGALLVNSHMTHVHRYSKMEMRTKLRIQEKRKKVPFFLHLNRYDPCSI